MLVLSRKAGERIQIGEDISLEVRRIAGNRVTIAFRAPRDVRILRGELQHAVEAFEPQAPSGSPEQQATPELCVTEEPCARQEEEACSDGAGTYALPTASIDLKPGAMSAHA